MTEGMRPLPIYPYPLSEVDMGSLRLAKSKMSVDWKVLPRPAVPGSPGRILAFREAPTFLCDYALIRDPQNGDAMLAALQWATGNWEDERATTVLDTLKSIFGEGVREITDEVDPDEPTKLPMPDFSKAFDLTDQRAVSFR